MDNGLFEYLSNMLTDDRKKRFAEILAYRTRHITVAMEDVYQMHNFSAVIRSCDVFGVQDAHVIQQKYGDRLDKNIAMGAQKWVDIYRYASWQACVNHLKQRGYRILATTPHGQAISLHELTLEQPTAFFFGTEKKGLSPEIIAQADACLSIPMYGFTESLNISASVAIILQYARQLMAQWADFPGLTEIELSEKTSDWVKKSIKNVDAIVAHYLSERKTP